jgi:aryl-alcohol dehydrogenase-like predicted oxidoreductase
MSYRVLGRTALSVSEVGFGGAPAGLRNYLGHWDPTQPEAAQQVEAAIQRAVELGVNYFDTAAAYGKGLSEAMFGRALRPHRDKVVIATKTKATDAAAVRESLEQSLARLQTDYVDVLQFHGTWYDEADVERVLRPGGVLDGLKALRAEGRARFIGFTSEGVDGAVSRLIATDEFDVMQICYNVIFQHPYEPSQRRGVMYEAEAHGIGIVVMRPLTSGVFQRWLRTIYPDIDRQADLAKATLSFVLSNPLTDVAIVGMRSPARVEANCAIAHDTSARIDHTRLHAWFADEQ